MDKIILTRLWDLYHALLTKTQQEITDLYFNYDLTVSEIAQQKGVSRQSVSDCIKVSLGELIAYEQKLELYKRLMEKDVLITYLVEGTGRWEKDFLTLHPEYKAEFEALDNILDKSKEGINEMTAFFSGESDN